MKLRQAISYHASTYLDAWSLETGWVKNALQGNFMPFDRFITERSFGQKKRIFLSNPKKGPIPEQYTVAADPSGRPYLIAAHNKDFYQGEEYNDIYLLQEGPYMVDILRHDVKKAASGAAKSKTLLVVSSVPGDLERMTSLGSEAFPTVDYTNFVVTLPRYTEVTTDNELRISGVRYDITEVWASMQVVMARVNKRSSGV